MARIDATGGAAAKVGLERRRSRERAALLVVDDLRRDVPVGRNTARRGRSAVPWTLRRTRLWRRKPQLALVLWPALSSLRYLLRGLAGLAHDVLADVADALALVGLGLLEGTDVGGNLADDLLVDPDHVDLGLEGTSNSMPSGA